MLKTIEKNGKDKNGKRKNSLKDERIKEDDECTEREGYNDDNSSLRKYEQKASFFTWVGAITQL